MNNSEICRLIADIAKNILPQDAWQDELKKRIKLLSGCLAELPEEQRHGLIHILVQAALRSGAVSVLDSITGDKPNSLSLALKSVDRERQHVISLQLATALTHLDPESVIQALINCTSPSRLLLHDHEVALARLAAWIFQEPKLIARIMATDSVAAVFEKKPEHHYVPNYFGPSHKKLIPLHDQPTFGVLAAESIATGLCSLHYDRLFTLFNVLAGMTGNGVSGFGVVEVGVYRGGTSYFLARVMESLRFSECPLHSCDTFEGHNPVDLVEGIDRYTSAHFVNTTAQDVRALLAQFPFAHVHVGRIQDTYKALPDRIGLLHLDTDLYEPTRFVLNHFFDRLVLNGAIVVDDFGTKSCPGVKQAVDEFARTHPDAFVLPMLTAQCVITKSGGNA